MQYPINIGIFPSFWNCAECSLWREVGWICQSVFRASQGWGWDFNPGASFISVMLCASCSTSLTITFLNWGKKTSFIHWEHPLVVANSWCWRKNLCLGSRAKIPALSPAVFLVFSLFFHGGSRRGFITTLETELPGFAVLWDMLPSSPVPLEITQSTEL